jgi:serine/threonine protein kinase
MALTSGTKLGPYEIIAPLGAGGMGEVYRPRDTRLDRTAAMKVLPANRMTAGGLYCFALIERASSCSSTTFVCCCISRNKDM